jgi:hypothetical protein
MREVKRELHIDSLLGFEVYQEFNSSCNVENLWYDRLAKNNSVLTACLVYKYKHNGKVIQVINLK